MTELAARAAPISLPPAARRACPTVLQMEAVECGAAALAMVLAHHGLWVPLDTLRVECGVSRDGSNAVSLVKAARRYGLEADGWRLRPDEVAGKPMPAIAFWQYNHFVVVEGIGKNEVYLNDPALGRRKVSHAEFVEGFTGILLTVQPTPAFRPGGERPRAWRALVGQGANAWDAILFLLVIGLFLIVPGILVPAFAKIFVDEVLARSVDGWLQPLMLGMAATALLRGALTWVQQVHLQRLQLKFDVAISAGLMWQLLRLPMAFFTQRYAGDVAARADAAERFAQGIAGQLSTTFFNLVSIVFFAAVMALYDGPLALVGVSLALLNVVALGILTRLGADHRRRQSADETRLLGIEIGGVQAIETLKATGRESDFFSRWAGWQAKVGNAQQAFGVKTAALDSLAPFLSGLTTAAVLGYGGLRVMDGHLTLGALVAFQTLLASFSRPIEGLVGAANQIDRLKGDLDLIEEVLRQPVEAVPAEAVSAEAVSAETGNLRQGPETGGPGKLAGAVSVRHLTFGYNPVAPPILKDVSFTVEPGGWLAVVGRSGSGKSTVAKLLTGLAKPWSGEILFDGRADTAWSRSLLTGSIASVSQEIVLFSGTIRDNLTLWDATVPDADVVAAAHDADIHDVIAARPGGYGSVLEEGGRNLSGGQVQRLELARALAALPAILILDEATSALDPLTEARVLAALRRRGITVIVVAHRLSAIRDCDEIIVLDQGRIVQRGSHATLNAVPGPYAELIRAE